MPGQPYKKIVRFVPSAVPLILYLFAWAILALGLILAIAYGYGAFQGADQFQNFTFLFGFMVLPATALLSQIAALIERKIPAKLVLGLSGTLALVLATTLAGVAFSMDPDMGFPLLEGIGASMLCFTPFVLLSMILPIYALVRLPKAMQRMHSEERKAWVREIIEARGGQARYADLADALNTSQATVDALLRQMLEAGEIAGMRLPQHQCFLTEPALEARRHRLQGMITAQGTVALDTLAHELDVPKGLIREWLHDLVRDGAFTGYLNWEDELVYSREARHLRAGGVCPNCGGPMGLAGKGVIRCDHCDTEVFITA